MKFYFQEDLSKSNIESVQKGLRNYNSKYIEEPQSLNFGCFVRSKNDSVIGGLVGHQYHSILQIHYIWVAEKERGNGIGKKLLENSELEAIRKNIKSIFLDTFTFQSPWLYEKAGYIEVGRYTDYPQENIDRIFYKKQL